MRNLNKTILLVLMFAALATTAFGSGLLSDQGTNVQLSSTGTTVEVGNLTIEIYGSAAGVDLVWEGFYPNSIANGSWNLILGDNATNPLNLNYLQTYYKEYLINGEELDFTDSEGNALDRLPFVSPIGPILRNNYIGNISINGTLYADNISSNSPLQLQTSGTTRLYVEDTTGYVGIGTSTPTSQLHVNGTVNVTRAVHTDNISANSDLHLTNAGTTRIKVRAVEGSIAIGDSARAFGTDAIAIGFGGTLANATFGLAMGTASIANGSQSIAMGTNVKAAYTRSFAAGTGISVHGLNSFAYGGPNGGSEVVTDDNVFVIGSGLKTGIGVLSPSYELDVSGTTQTDHLILSNRAQEGAVAISDENGNMTWRPAGPFNIHIDTWSDRQPTGSVSGRYAVRSFKYNKTSDTSDLIVEGTLSTRQTSSVSTTIAGTFVDNTYFDIMAYGGTSSNGFTPLHIHTRHLDVGAGVLNISVYFGRNDTSVFTFIVNPQKGDDSAFPEATNSFVKVYEVEQ